MPQNRPQLQEEQQQWQQDQHPAVTVMEQSQEKQHTRQQDQEQEAGCKSRQPQSGDAALPPPPPYAHGAAGRRPRRGRVTSDAKTESYSSVECTFSSSDGGQSRNPSNANPVQLDSMVKEFKTLPCGVIGSPLSHDHRSCPFYHSHRDRRRVVTFDGSCPCYRAEPCDEQFDSHRLCSRGDHCTHAHSTAELLYHPDVFRRRICHQAKRCPRGRFCAFAHSRQELLVPHFGETEEAEPTEEFIAYSFKTQWCPIGGPHDWENCVYAHTYRDWRRTPLIGYSSRPCPQWAQSLSCGSPEVNYDCRCPRGVACPLAHGSKEQLYHPNFYKTSPCSGAHCKRGALCAFTHGVHDARRPRPDEPAYSGKTEAIPNAASMLCRYQPTYSNPPKYHALEAPPRATPGGGRQGQGQGQGQQQGRVGNMPQSRNGGNNRYGSNAFALDDDMAFSEYSSVHASESTEANMHQSMNGHIGYRGRGHCAPQMRENAPLLAVGPMGTNGYDTTMLPQDCQQYSQSWPQCDPFTGQLMLPGVTAWAGDASADAWNSSCYGYAPIVWDPQSGQCIAGMSPFSHSSPTSQGQNAGQDVSPLAIEGGCVHPQTFSTQPPPAAAVIQDVNNVLRHLLPDTEQVEADRASRDERRNEYYSNYYTRQGMRTPSSLGSPPVSSTPEASPRGHSKTWNKAGGGDGSSVEGSGEFSSEETRSSSNRELITANAVEVPMQAPILALAAR